MKGGSRRSATTLAILVASLMAVASFADEQQQQVCQPRVPPDCKIVMAASTLNHNNSGWGLFVLDNFQRAQRVLYGDVVIQLVDLPAFHPGLSTALRYYWWSAQETGGFYEGRSVVSFIPGVGSLANGVPQSNVLPATPFYDEGGLTRSESPGAGAITMYHNYSFHVASQSLQAGDELLVNYGQKWFEERSSELVNIAAPAHVDPELLRSTGYCVDNIMAGRSKVAHAGRGAFASRHLANRTIVAPVPVLVLPKEALQIVRQRQDSTVFVGYQLLLNYCYGHPSSSRLLCPYGPMVNLINHGAGKYANVKLQWAQPPSSSDQFADTMLLELVAIRPIQKGQELLLDYGSDWVNAWTNHVKHWEPGSAMYVPSYVQNDVVKTLRTEQELKLHPYPENVFTSCYYRYSNQTKVNHNNNNDDDNSVTTVQWKFTRGLLEPRHLRPCRILKRHEGDRLYTVQIRNRYGLPDSQRTPQVHIVTHVPRPFIVFSDKLYTTDPHLETAFRQSIGLSDFPDSWMDVKVEDDGDDTRATE